MRPLHGDDTWAGRQRQRAARLLDRDAPLTTTSASNSHMSFFITDEASLDSHRGRSAVPPHFRGSKKVIEQPRTDDRGHQRDDEPSCSSSSRASFFSQSPVSLPSQAQPSSVSRPLTPIMLGPSCVGSAGSSSSSRRNSFTSSLSDRAANYDRESASEPASAPSMLDSGSAPQLVMPSIMMPSRRPFTETGKNLGRLKILLAGDSGVGKTSLLKAIVQICHHIVHVDPIPPLSGFNKALRPDMATSRRESLSTTTISEVHASTKPFPEWWRELDAPGVSHKRKRLGDNVLERNICFVDTPGYGRGSSVMETIIPCVDYIESHLKKVSSDDLSDLELINILGGSGGCQVDAVLYLISHTLKAADLEYIRRLIPLTNVIPVLTRAELLSEERIAACKQEIAGQLGGAGIQSFSFTTTATQEKLESSIPSIPYTASSATVSDHDMMDASLLMSPDYVQPLIPTDLAFLVEKIFSLDGAAWLRHSAAKKYLQWRELTPRRPCDLYRPLTPPVPSPDYPLVLQQLSLSLARRPGLHQGDGMAQAEVADWASELQRCLVIERLRYETLARSERAVWLTEKLHECVQDGALVAATKLRETRNRRRRGTSSKRHASSKTRQHQDPLGLLQMAADLKIKSWMAVEVLGSLGMVGLVLWVSRHGWPTKAIELVDGWVRF
ncbi:Septin-domain-containing protein [Xylaria sp. FL1777]|nr:Septin-domain-containing protein [Xylaria sp. FL1777]